MKKAKNLSTVRNKVTACVVALFAFIAPWIFYSCRVGYVFIDSYTFSGLSMTLFFIMVFNALVAAANAFLLLTGLERVPEGKKEKLPLIAKGVWISEIVVSILTALFTVAWVVFFVVLGEESSPLAGRMLASVAPYMAITFCAVFFALFFPAVKNGKARLTVLCFCVVAGIIGLTSAIFPFGKFEFISDPAVIDTGDGYSVVFALSDTGTGYIEYEFGGKEYRIYNEDGGRKVNARIHSFTVPYEAAASGYKVGATRVTDELTYGGRVGKSIESGEYEIKPIKGEEQKYLCVSDWHTELKKAKKTAGYISGYDGIILLGDAAAGLQYEEEAAEYVVGFAGDLSKGSVPIIYARGNHETRGAYASELRDALNLKEFYTDIKVGNYRFIVLDSAEDKEDGHAEYGQMADYSAYRERMVEFLEGLNAEEGEKIVVICHDYKICREEELSERALAKLGNLGATVILCGHYHEVGFGEIGGIPYFIDGGKTDEGFIVSEVRIRESGITMTAIDEDGKTVDSYKIDEWK